MIKLVALSLYVLAALSGGCYRDAGALPISMDPCPPDAGALTDSGECKIPLGSPCVASTDCESNACVNRVCVPPTCTDGIKNADETDVDCGGGNEECARCGTGKLCWRGGDCSLGFYCTNNRCWQAACSNQMRDGQETDVDCGGPQCRKCGAGRRCSWGMDCQSGVCPLGSLTCQ